jgi:hypothetical protein
VTTVAEKAKPIAIGGEAAEVALAETQAVLAMVSNEERRLRLADLIATINDGELDPESDEAQALGEVLELGLHTGRVRGVYGPGGEQAALKLFRRLPRGKELSASAKAVSEALGALAGKQLDSVKIDVSGPGSFVLSLAVEGRELSVRLDRLGVRLASVGV